MAERLDNKQVVSVGEALKMEMMINQALIDILIEKGIFTEVELLGKLEKLKQEMP